MSNSDTKRAEQVKQCKIIKLFVSITFISLILFLGLRKSNVPTTEISYYTQQHFREPGYRLFCVEYFN